MHRSVVVIVVCLGALAASATLALAHSTPYAWTVSKARVMLQEGTNIAMPEDQRATLAAEVQAWLDKLRPLQLTAQSDPDNRYWRQAAMYGNAIDRFVDVRDTIARGLSIDSVKCAGQGKALTGKRYKHFRCNAASYVLEVPNIELVPGADPFLPEVVEGPRKLVGPLQAVYTVHVTGKARMLSRRAG